MTKLQITSILSCFVLFLVLYFGCDYTSPEQKEAQALTGANMVSTDISVLLKDAGEKLDPSQASVIEMLDAQIEEAQDSVKIDLMKQLSGKWYEFGYPEVAGFYAQTIADKENTESAWSIAGTTYSICVQRAEEQKVRDYCFNNAVAAFESAASVNPDNPQHRVNLAVLYTDNPPPQNPMKGILLLRELTEKYPENASVRVNLGRLAIKTSQFDKAIERLSQALELEPNNRQAVCLLAQAYQAKGDTANAEAFAQRCQGSSTAN